MTENKKISLSDFFEPDANLHVMKFKEEGYCDAVLIVRDMNELNLMHILVTGIGRYYLAMRLNSRRGNDGVELKEAIKMLLDAEFDAVDNEYFNERK